MFEGLNFSHLYSAQIEYTMWILKVVRHNRIGHVLIEVPFLIETVRRCRRNLNYVCTYVGIFMFRKRIFNTLR